MISQAVGYLRDCFINDNTSSELWNIFSSRLDQLLLLPAFDSDSSSGSSQKMPESYGHSVLPMIETYRREKNFRHFHYFIVGKRQKNHYGKQRSSTFCAPLFSADSQIDLVDGEYFGHAADDAECNHALLELLLEDGASGEGSCDVSCEELAAQLSSAITNSPKPQDPQQLVELFKSFNSELDLSVSDASFSDKKSFGQAFKGLKQGRYYLVAMSGFALLERSRSTRGILDELGSLYSLGANSKPQYSSPLSLSLNPSFNPSLNPSLDSTTTDKLNPQAKPARCDLVPGLLSDAQKAIMQATATSPLSLLIGPPGTGKSYTIASIAIERFMQGESVLIVSQNEHAIDVIKEKITETFGLNQTSVMRAGTKDYHKQLKQHLDNLLVKKQPQEKLSQEKQSGAAQLAKQLEQLNKEISAAEELLNSRFLRAENEGRLFQQLESGNRGFNLVTKIKLWWSERYLNKMGLLAETLDKVQKLNGDKDALLSRYIDRLAKDKVQYSLHHHRRQITGFKSALSARTSQRQEKILAELDFSILLESMPIWLCSLEGLHKTLPLTHELFDLVIIDEATQCDIASCLPALQRAKRALVVGDPKQLRHISFLAKDKQQQIFRQHQLDKSSLEISYRDHSMIDLAQRHIHNQGDIVMLNEHYRSAPDIIRFSNQHFYQNQLRLMTEKPAIEAKKHIDVIPIANGQRIDGINIVEADAIIEKIHQLIIEQEKVAKDYKLSIGVLSFFSDQARYIQDRIFQTFDLEQIITHKLRCGTPYAFQGEERDVMLISCGVDADSVAGTYTYINRPDVFNVGITRARELQLLFLSCPVEQLPDKSLLKQLILSFQQHQRADMGIKQNREVEIQQLIDCLQGQSNLQGEGYQVLLNYPLAGVEMDVGIMHEEETLAIDLIGFGGQDDQVADAFHLERYKIFERAGLTIIPLCIFSWKTQPEALLLNIQQTFKRLKEKNTLSRIDQGEKLGLWCQLLSLNSQIAQSTRVIEEALLALKAEDQRGLLDQLIDQFKKVHWILAERLNPTELTYIRYAGAADQVYLAALDQFKRWADINNSQLTLDQEQQALLTQLMAEIHDSVAALEQLAFKWGKAVTQSQLAETGLTDAMAELERLSDSVDDYAV